jgi:predicted nucleic acid-binding protein
MYLLDTNIISYLVRGKNNIQDKVANIPFDELAISSITFSELLYGSSIIKDKVQSNLLITTYLNIAQELELLDFDYNSAIIFSDIKSDLKKLGKLVADTDIQIASIAINNNLILITNNTKDFINMKNLKLDNWIKN